MPSFVVHSPFQFNKYYIRKSTTLSPYMCLVTPLFNDCDAIKKYSITNILFKKKDFQKLHMEYCRLSDVVLAGSTVVPVLGEVYCITVVFIPHRGSLHIAGPSPQYRVRDSGPTPTLRFCHLCPHHSRPETLQYSTPWA